MMDYKLQDDSMVGAAVEVESVEEVQETEKIYEYELTVTEDSLMRLHGLSLTLPLPCDLCPIGTVFDDLDEFDAHMSEHPEAKMFACQLCNNTYKSWSNLVAHRKMFHFGEVLSCERCGSLRSHARLEGSVHYPVGNKPHGCEECEVGLDTISDVYRHYFFHKAPPGGSRRRGGNNFGQKRKVAAAVEGHGSQGENGSLMLDTSQSLSGTSISDLRGDQMTNLSGGTAKANLSGNLVTSPSNRPHGNLSFCPSGNVSGVSGANEVENLPGNQNGNLIENVTVIPSGNSLGNLTGIRSRNLSMKRAGVQGRSKRGKLHGKQSESLIMTPAGIQGGDVTVNPVGIQSDNSSMSPSGPSNLNVLEDLSDTQTEIMIGSAAVIQDPSSSITPTGSKSRISDCKLFGDQMDKQSRDSPSIKSETMGVYLAEESKNSLEGSNSQSHTVGQNGGLRAIAPKSGLAKNTGQMASSASNQISEPLEHDDNTMSDKHICPHCTFSSDVLEDYWNHLISNASAHDCVMCSVNHFKRISPTDHEYCQSQTRQFNCIPCTTILESEREFDEHLTKHHNAVYLPCCLCGKKFNWIIYVEHVKSCQHKCIEWKFRKQLCCKTCQPCGKIFHSAGALRRHMKRHELNRKLLYDCKVCGRTFQHGGAYAKHLWANPTHGPPEQRAKIPGMSTNYICEKCGKTFSKREGLKSHLMRHAGVRPHACTICPKSFITRTSLVVHVRQHTGERPYMCETCGKNFTGPTSLYVHQRKHRTDDGRGGGIRATKAVKKPSAKHTCPVCGKTLSSKLIFEGHIRQHTGERPFVCEVCGRGFATSKIMKLHAKRHEKDRPARKVCQARWVHDISNVASKADIEGGFDSNSSSTCIFLCPRCGLGMVSPDELEDHLAKGDCTSGGAEMYVLPMTNESECIDTGSMVDID